MSVNQKTICITGVSSGIGFAIAKDLIEQGHLVFGSVRKAEDAAELAALSDNFVPLLFDVTDLAGIDAAVDAVRQRIGNRGLDVLINNAGVSAIGPICHQPVDEIRFVMEVNFFGTLNVTRAFLPLLGGQTNYPHTPGKIINIGSVAGAMTVPFMVAYSASKHALEALGQGLRRELMPFGIEVCTIEPSFVKSKITENSRKLAGGKTYADTIYAKIWPKFFDRLDELDATAPSTDALVKRTNVLIAADKPKTRNPLDPVWYIARLLPDRVFDKPMFKNLKLDEFLGERV